MALISKPLEANVFIAESRPGPIPFTKTSTSKGPVLESFSAIAPATLEAAKGVAFLGPEKPKEPADIQAMVLPSLSVTLIKVLLYEALIYTLPFLIFLFLDPLLICLALFSSIFLCSLAISSFDFSTTCFLPILSLCYKFDYFNSTLCLPLPAVFRTLPRTVRELVLVL